MLSDPKHYLQGSHKSPILVTGCAGFIGFHVAKRLLGEDLTVVGINNLNDYCDVNLKQARLAQLLRLAGLFARVSLEERQLLALGLSGEESFE